MQNKLKPATIGVIETINKANIRTIMATGDNMLTALSVGKKCNLISREKVVFLGDLEEANGYETINWRLFVD